MTITEAIEKVKAEATSKFDETIELHLNLDIDPKKNDQTIRYTTVLPHGTGKTVRVAVFASEKITGADVELTEAEIAKIEKGTLKPKTDFDIVVAEPQYMAKLAKVAAILGPAGMMPNPKSGTVTDKVQETVNQIKKGKIEIRNEAEAPLIHTVLGKKSFATQALVENFTEIMKSLRQNKPQKVKPDFVTAIRVCSTMGKAVTVELEK